MEEQQVNVIPLVSDAETALSSYKGKVLSQFQQKALQVVEQSFLQIVF
jgi:hypothetical protein